MINPQITDSVTQIIRYKDGTGSGHPSKITFKYYEDSLYDDMIKQFNDSNNLHLPNIDECKILHEYFRTILIPKDYMTTESFNKDEVTCANIREQIFIQKNRADKQPVLLIQIEYEQ